MKLAPDVPARHAHPESRSQNLVRLGVKPDRWDYLVALAGNPNTGKTTVFNGLTGLRQHTGNWPGKTVVRAEGAFVTNGKRVKVVDLPGTYSLQAGSTDEEVARDFILFGRPDVTIVVVDATRLERNLNLVLQILEITDRVVICLNLVDEARRHGIAIDADALSRELGVPVVPAVARKGEGIEELLAVTQRMAEGKVPTRPYRIPRLPDAVEDAIGRLAPGIEAAYPGVPNARWVALRLLNADEVVEEAVEDGELGLLAADGDGAAPKARPGGSDGAARRRVLEIASGLRWSLNSDFHDAITERIYESAQEIARASEVRGIKRVRFDLDRALDRVLTSRVLGFPIMLLLLAVVFWITIVGANVPSQWLSHLLIDDMHPRLLAFGATLHFPAWLNGVLFDGA